MLEHESIDEFYSEGFITDVIRPVKSGKEASVYLCRANRSVTGRELLAAKVYRPREHRSFRNDSLYKAGRVLKEGRDRRAVKKRTGYGRQLDEGWWISREWETLRTLHDAGADVPAPVAMAGQAILMEYLGDEEAPAPQLRQVKLDPDEARVAFETLLRTVELALAHNVVHADLSAFNVLWWNERACVIDFPQAVDPRSNRNAESLLARDVENLCAHFQKQGVPSNPSAILRDLWTRFLFAEL